MRNKFARVSDPNEYVSNPGSTIKVEYSPKVLSDGRIELKPSGKIDIKAMINSQRELTDINYIVKQIENGNYDVINPVEPFYGDSTKFPQTYAEVLQLRIDAEKSFYELPLRSDSFSIMISIGILLLLVLLSGSKSLIL